MTTNDNSSVWYGELRTSRGNTIVIRDDQLPPASKGRIYIYNTERDAIIQYDEAIVSDKLFELDKEQQQQAENQFKSSWEVARKKFMRTTLKTTQSKESSAEDLLSDDTDDDDLDDDSFDDDD